MVNSVTWWAHYLHTYIYTQISPQPPRYYSEIIPLKQPNHSPLHSSGPGRPSIASSGGTVTLIQSIRILTGFIVDNIVLSVDLALYWLALYSSNYV